jgi:16S rRNA (adenine1518-N6/adenine1519-N6)-dimethyltransferase
VELVPPKFELLHADALEFLRVGQASSLSSSAKKSETGKMPVPLDWSNWKLVANLPYSVASPILVELAQSPKRPERMVTTLQLEVAQRLMAQADDDDYGVLTLLVQLDYEPRDSFKIPADCFFPAPNVDSMCVVLQRRARPLLAGEQRAAFVKIVKRAFSQRRKMMLKLLKMDWPKEKLERAFVELKISPQERAEKLSLEQFVALAEKLF